MDFEYVKMSLDACVTRTQVEALWTKVYITYREEAWKIWKLFEEKRRTVINTPEVFSEELKSYGWD